MRVIHKSGLLLGAALLMWGPAGAMAQEFPTILQMQDSQGNIQSVICRPATAEEQARLPLSTSQTLVQPKPTPTAAAAKPVSKPAGKPAAGTSAKAPSYRIIPNYPVPGAPAPSTLPPSPIASPVVQPSVMAVSPVTQSVGPQPSQAAITPSNNQRLYANPADVEAAFNYFAMRPHAYAPRGVSGPDPAFHGELASLKSVAPPVARVGTAARTSPKPIPVATAPAPADTAANGANAGTAGNAINTNPGAAGSAPSAQVPVQTPAQVSPQAQSQPPAAQQTAPQGISRPQTPGVSPTQPGTLPSPTANTQNSGLPVSQNGAPGTGNNGNTMAVPPGNGMAANSSAQTNNALLNAAPVMPNATPQPRGVLQ